MLTSDMSSKYLESKGIKFVETKILDPFGRLRSRTYPVRRFDVLKERGFRVDGSSIGYADVERSDMSAEFIDNPNMELPQYGTAIFLCELYDDGMPVKSFGRNVLKKTLEGTSSNVRLGIELEFYFTTEDREPIDQSVYMESAPGDTTEKLKKEFMLLTEKANSDLGIQVAHAEVGNGQHETELTYSDPVNLLDRLTLLKYLLKIFAQENGLRATTMPKPFHGQAGNGMHAHISLWKDGESLFYGTGDEISEVAKMATGGILKHSPQIAIFTNSTVNSYKRLVPGHEAPIHPVWGYENRTAMIRIPKSNGLTEENTRLEVRNLDAANDPYMAVAALIRAAQTGIEGGKNFDVKAFEGNADKLTDDELIRMGLAPFPRDLSQAISLAEQDGSIAKEVHPDFDRFILGKKEEQKSYIEFLGKSKPDPGSITGWELEMYFNL